MGWFAIILLILLGLIAVVLEIIVVPGGLLGILGLGSMGLGVGFAYASHGTTAGHITLFATLVIVVVALIFTLRRKTWRKLMLSTEIDAKVNQVNEAKLHVGMEGVTLSRLAPMGKANFDGEIVEVDTYQDFIDEKQPVVIVKIEPNKIIVKLNK